MRTMNDLRLALWNAYVRCNKHDHIEGKMAEASCEAIYPPIWDYLDSATTPYGTMPEAFAQPEIVKVYSYALGPSRTHEFHLAATYREIDYRTWESPDPIQTAIDVVNDWADVYCNAPMENNDE